MFDFGFGELLLLAIIALVVLGPERLPIAARLLGRWIRTARSQWNAVKSELENELADEELRRNLRETSDAMREGAANYSADFTVQFALFWLVLVVTGSLALAANRSTRSAMSACTATSRAISRRAIDRRSPYSATE